jgi:hypothetical protein
MRNTPSTALNAETGRDPTSLNDGMTPKKRSAREAMRTEMPGFLALIEAVTTATNTPTIEFLEIGGVVIRGTPPAPPAPPPDGSEWRLSTTRKPKNT